MKGHALIPASLLTITTAFALQLATQWVVASTGEVPARLIGTAQTTDVVSLRQLAQKGDAKAQLTLGQCYEHGRGVEEDQVEAQRWCRLAAEHGYAPAQNSLQAAGAGSRLDKRQMKLAVGL